MIHCPLIGMALFKDCHLSIDFCDDGIAVVDCMINLNENCAIAAQLVKWLELNTEAIPSGTSVLKAIPKF